MMTKPTDGCYNIKNVPPGTYTVRAFNNIGRIGPGATVDGRAKEVVVPPNGTVNVEIELFPNFPPRILVLTLDLQPSSRGGI